MFLYVIGGEKPPYKIGITSNLEKRVKQLQTGNPFPLSVQYYKELPPDTTKEFEKILHFTLRESRTSGEWFNIELDKIKLEVDYCEIRFLNETNALQKLKQGLIR